LAKRVQTFARYNKQPQLATLSPLPGASSRGLRFVCERALCREVAATSRVGAPPGSARSAPLGEGGVPPCPTPALGSGRGLSAGLGGPEIGRFPPPSAEGFHTHGSRSTAGGAMTDAPWPNREATAHCMTGGDPQGSDLPAPLGTGEHPPFAFSKEAEAPPTSHPKGALGGTTPPRPRGAGLIRGVGSPTRPPWMTGSVLADSACGHHEGVPSRTK
jgi:hypothetical protein